MAEVCVRLVYLLCAVGSAGLAFAAWRRRTSSPVAAPAVSLCAAAMVWWASCDLVVVTVTDPGVQGVALAGVSTGLAVLVAGFRVQARALVHPQWRPDRRTALLAVVPVLATVAAVTNPWHRLLLESWAPNPATGWVVWRPGPLFWLHAAWSYGLVAVSLGDLLRGRRTATALQRRQIDVVLAAAVLPVVGGLPAVLPWIRDGLPDTTVVLFCVTVLVQGFAILRLGHLDLVPVARGVVLEGLPDAVFVLDVDDRLVDVNAAARRLVDDLVPGRTGRLLGAHGPDLLRRGGFDGQLPSGEIRLEPAGRPVVLDVRVTPLEDGTGRRTGTVVVARDVTEAEAHRAALAAANDRLRAQVETIERLRGELAEQALRDELTGLHNRRHLVVALDLAVTRARVQDEDLAVVLLDIDRFKDVNDRHGHAAGDALLVATAQVLADGVRADDTVARYGGEEFVVLLPGTTPEQAVHRAQEWRRQCAAITLPAPHDAARTTISAGVATVSRVGGDPTALLQAADTALYAAKAGGRDRVVLAAATTVG